MRVCGIEECGEKHFGLGYCQLHYTRLRRHGDPLDEGFKGSHPEPVAERLAARSERRGDCLIYTEGYESRSGHVLFSVNGGYMSVSRAAWIEANGREPGEGIVVRHTCDTPRCIEPKHLILGTTADNNRDRDERGRHVALYGEDNGFSKLANSDVFEIRRLLDRGMAQATIGAQFGVSQRCIWSIAHGKTWAHLVKERSA